MDHHRPQQRHQARGHRSDPVGHGGHVEIDALVREHLALARQRQMQAVLAEDDLGQKVRAGSATVDGVEGRRRLSDRLAPCAGHLLAHVLDHEPAGRRTLKALGHGFAELAQTSAAAGAGTRAGVHDAMAR